MAARKKKINLLPKDEFDRSFLGKFLKWALTVGRYIVIGTELVVIGSFLARFSLDRQVTDLNEAIAQKQAIIDSFGTLEADARSIQARLVVIGDVSEDQLKVAEFLDKTSSFTPVDVVYTVLGFSQDEVTLSGVAFSEAGFRTLLLELGEDESFEKVAVERVTSEGDQGGGIEFDIKLTLPASTQALPISSETQG